MNHTIVALATPRGEGAIAIIRLSGQNALDIACKVTHKSSLTPRFAHLSTLFDEAQNPFDQAIVIWFANPKSYTGEDLVEFQIHGSVASADKLISTLIFYGAKPARSGEFTTRALHNGKIDIAQAEAITAMISAKSTKALTILARQMRGELQVFVDEIRSKLIRARAHIEVAIDYAEDDIPADILSGIASDLIALEALLVRTISASKSRAPLISGYKIVILGKPNVGKSSLLNALLNYERAIVTDIAGTTRDTVEEHFFVDGVMVRIVDTAGIREASDAVEKIGIAKSKEALTSSDLAIFVVDGSAPFDQADLAILELIRGSDKQFFVAINKIDLDQQIDKNAFADCEIVEVCAKNGADQIKEKLASFVSSDENFDEITLVSVRQISAVEETLREIVSAKEALSTGALELFSYHCNQAIKEIETLTKPFVYDELLDAMFGEFCLGK